MINNCFYVLIIYSVISITKTAHPKTRSGAAKNIKTNIDSIQPINLQGAPNANLANLNGPKKEQRHQQSYYISEKQKGNKPEKSLEQHESVEDTYIKAREDVAGREEEEDREQEEEEAEAEEADMKNDRIDDELFYDFADDELRITLRK